MRIWFESLLNGIKIYSLLAPASIAAALFLRRERKELNPFMFLINQLAVLYGICLISVTLFPLPDAAQAAKLSTYDAQLIPFRFVGDIIREKTLKSIAQVVFNIFLTVPLGILLSFKANMSEKKAVAISLGVSLFIELAQLTGLFFIYSGSYRLFDVDDLFLNTLGGFIGFRMASAFAVRLPRVILSSKLSVSVQ